MLFTFDTALQKSVGDGAPHRPPGFDAIDKSRFQLFPWLNATNSYNHRGIIEFIKFCKAVVRKGPKSGAFAV